MSSMTGSLPAMQRDGSTKSGRNITPRVDIIKQNKLAVKSANMNIFLNSNVANSAHMEKLNKYTDGVSDSMANSMTNFSKNKDTDNNSIQPSYMPQMS